MDEDKVKYKVTSTDKVKHNLRQMTRISIKFVLKIKRGVKRVAMEAYACESGSLISCGRENTQNFISDFEVHNHCPEEFLRRQSSVRIRDAKIGTLAQNL
ncbi:Hypothetical predicted protein [Mytilus galloprovincialis]|uniref:Uncharacterized protein n=1 Tax=Mytilus galloprovincialis TaxID=29158 RepID=A0A8B6GKJ1_MYTGA|nr:Hypothetical predicted protein [Mytilus galloprovincialis]